MMNAEQEQNIKEVRDALFLAADGKPLDDVMIGLIMAQGKVVASAAGDPETARELIDHYHFILRDGIAAYCAEFAN